MNRRPRLVLASASPRRAELLAPIGVRFEIRPPDVDESTRPHEPAHDYAARLARAKATASFSRGAIVIAADTTVVVDDDILGKPADAGDARAMLTRLAGRAHEVLTGVAVAADAPSGAIDVLLGGREGPWLVETVTTTTVWMTDLTDAEIDWYVATGEPLDKAGAYGIQGIGGMFVQYLHGSYQNVVGLPLADVDELLSEHGHRLLDWAESTGPPPAGR
jgi:septum formation protein